MCSSLKGSVVSHTIVASSSSSVRFDSLPPPASTKSMRVDHVWCNHNFGTSEKLNLTLHKSPGMTDDMTDDMHGMTDACIIEDDND